MEDTLCLMLGNGDVAGLNCVFDPHSFGKERAVR